MKVFNCSMYGQGTVIVTPGKELRDHEEFFESETDADNVVHRKFRTIAVRFTDGAAEVSDVLGNYLIEHGHATREAPTEMAQSQNERDFQEYVRSGQPVYATPIEVGTPLRSDIAEYLSHHRRQA